MIDLEKTVSMTDFYHCVIRQGFAFTSIMEPTNVLDAIIVRYPDRCQAWTPKLTATNRTFQEHIDFINKYKLEKAFIIAENIDFIVNCPSLKYLWIVPADTAPEQFDYSPLYRMPEIKFLKCTTSYGGSEEPLCTSIDCSNIKGIQMLELSGKGTFSHKNIESLEQLEISDCRIKDFSDISSCKALKKIWLTQTGVESLQCIEELQALQQLYLGYERRLHDVSGIKKVANSLRSLSIENCPKVTDFSFLMNLKNLEHLALKAIW